MLTIVHLFGASSPTVVDGGSSALDSLLPFLNFGIVGVLIVLIATKKVFVPKWSLDDLKESYQQALDDKDIAHERELQLRDATIAQLQTDRTELKTQNERLNSNMQERILPALFEANRLAAMQVEAMTRRPRRDDRDD